MSKAERLQLGHLHGCARLFVATFAAAPWGEPWSLVAARDRLAEVLATPGAYGLVRLNKETEAFVIGYGEQGYDGRVFYIKEMCVASSLQRRGVGTALMHKLEQALSGNGYGHVYLLTHRDGPAEAFYAKRGYRTSKRTVVMSRRLELQQQ